MLLTQSYYSIREAAGGEYLQPDEIELFESFMYDSYDLFHNTMTDESEMKARFILEDLLLKKLSGKIDNFGIYQ